MMTFSVKASGLILSIAVCFGCMAGDLAQQTTFHVGDPAPPLQMMKWIKGTPVRAFEPGRVYVVELWATWCGPCKEAMPHLTEIQKKYADRVTVIGVNVREMEHGSDNVIQTVQRFVDKMGGKMAYTVAMDDPQEQSFYKQWSVASGQYWIPTSFVIDKQGRLAWIGSPFEERDQAIGFEEAITQALEGTIDLAAARAQQDERGQKSKESKRLERVWKPVWDALEKKDYTAAVAEVDKVTAAQDANFKKNGFRPRLVALLHLNEKEALAYARKMTADDEENLQQAGWAIPNEDGLSKEAYQFAVDCLNQILILRPENAVDSVSGIANAYYKMGNQAKAVERQERALAMALNDKRMSEESIEWYRDQLAKYQQAR